MNDTIKEDACYGDIVVVVFHFRFYWFNFQKIYEKSMKKLVSWSICESWVTE